MGTTTDKLNKLIDTKAKIKEALEEKMDGQEVSDVFSEYSALIGTLPSTVKSTITAVSGTGSLFNCNLSSIDLRGWDLSNVSFANAFSNRSIVHANLSNTKNGPKSINCMFYPCGTLEDVDVTGLVTSVCTDVTAAFSGNGSLKTIKGLDTWDTSKVTKIDALFNMCFSITDLSGIEHWDTSSVTSMNSTFVGCKSLTELDLSHWDLSNLSTSNINAVFPGCSGLKKLNLSNIPLSKINELIGDYSNFGATDMDEFIARNVQADTTFYGQSFIHGNVKTIDVSNWTFDEGMGVGGMSSMPYVNIVGLDTWNVKIYGTSMTSFLASCSNLEAISGIENWDTSAITYMSNVFLSCPKIKEINVANWDTSNVTQMNYLFSSMSSLEKVDMSNWVVNSTTTPGTLGSRCPKLSTILFGPGWGKCAETPEKYTLTLDFSSLNSSGNDTYEAYQFSPETFDSMLQMYDRKANGLTAEFDLIFNKATVLPDGWKEKMEAKGYTVTTPAEEETASETSTASTT